MEDERLRTKFIRLHRIEELLITTQGGLKATELCKMLRVDRRTIYRDIALLEEMGVPVYKEFERYAILGTYKVPSYRSDYDKLGEKAFEALRLAAAICRQHNLLNGASENERTNTLERLVTWWNFVAVPVLEPETRNPEFLLALVEPKIQELRDYAAIVFANESL